MSFMGKIAKLDSAMQRGLDNSFAFVFGGRVVPAEIEELLKQEAEDNAVHTYEGTIEIPNHFEVKVSTKDYANLQEEHPGLTEDFEDQLTRYFRNQGWVCPGAVVVDIVEDPSVRTGQLYASSTIKTESEPDVRDLIVNPPTHAGFSVAEDEVDPPTEYFTEEVDAAPAAVSLLLQDGSSRTYYVHEGSNIIGRGNDVDFRLPDTGVSRKHAEIVWNGSDAILVDLQSTNGTTVNDTPIDNWLLADGDVITVGHSHIEVRIIN
ncbi:DUF3662 and FHA domain-containing protein [Corynebacterium felinum]|uniref:FHA domain-containing protein n=1 Tax=Corynebacterium felinum TaxID=131318 RepID=A0ABU2B6S7_9CORY|nr:DUF3662 and FHA domain-containing protein [Corynebacterium felinum]MDF5819555.1 DUF3662 and FHA domain-containing protein [Corynebacterium felinum]MDR7354317.1 hypothetical protein [Corynebacterium felinum]WJY93694.1 FHA domain-containing protein FhaA [Corynebacterium felinum]